MNLTNKQWCSVVASPPEGSGIESPWGGGRGWWLGVFLSAVGIAFPVTNKRTDLLRVALYLFHYIEMNIDMECREKCLKKTVTFHFYNYYFNLPIIYYSYHICEHAAFIETECWCAGGFFPAAD